MSKILNLTLKNKKKNIEKSIEKTRKDVMRNMDLTATNYWQLGMIGAKINERGNSSPLS